MTDQQIDDNRLRIGQLIAQLRQKKGLTQQELSDRTGILRSNIARVEAGRRNIGVDLLGIILEALDHKIEFVEIPLTEKMLEQ